MAKDIAGDFIEEFMGPFGAQNHYNKADSGV